MSRPPPPAPLPALSVAVRHRQGAFTLNAAFDAPPGVTALFGRSGAGKTTLVQAVAGLIRPDEGRIAVGDATLVDAAARIWTPPQRRRIGYVFQEGRLFPHLTVRGNLLFGRWFAPRGAPRASFDQIVEMLGIGPLLSRRPADLSGGEKQRVAIGRALLSSPRLLLMDEPLASLDEARKGEILPYIERLRDQGGPPILYVSHSAPEVARLATTVVALSEGRVVRVGPAVDVLSDPAAVPVTGRQQAGAILPARVVGRDEADGLTELAISGGRLFAPLIDAPVGAALRVRIRARDVTVSLTRPEGISALNVLPCVVADAPLDDGPILEVALSCGADRLRARVTRRSARRLGLAPGLACWAIIKTVAIGRRDVGAFAGRDDAGGGFRP